MNGNQIRKSAILLNLNNYLLGSAMRDQLFTRAYSKRINRIRFIYRSHLILLFMFIVSPTDISLFGIALEILFLVGYAFLAINRVHDFGQSGWLALVLGFPLINLTLWVIPGTKGENKYGRPTEKNRIPEIVLAIVLPLFINGYFLQSLYIQYTIAEQHKLYEMLQHKRGL